MKEKKKLSGKAKGILIAVAAVVVAAAIAVPVILLQQPKNTKGAATADSATGDEPAYSTEETFSVPLGFVTLKYPKHWEDKVKIDGKKDYQAGDSFTVAFSAKNSKLFDLLFNTEGGDDLGTLVIGDKAVAVRIKSYALSSKDADLLAMQENINVIIDNLKRDYGFQTGNAEMDASPEDNSVFAIKTDLVTLYYPQKWKDKVTVKYSDAVVSFSDGEVPLFDLCFKQTEGYQLGTYGETPVYIVDYPVKTNEQYAMKEDVNVILQYLAKDKNFRESTAE